MTIGTEHLLLGLLAAGPGGDPSVAARLLAERDITHQAVQDDVVEQLAGILRERNETPDVGWRRADLIVSAPCLN